MTDTACTARALTIHALAPEVLAGLRRQSEAVATTAEGGEPLRCCLRDATADERLLLVNHAPPLPPSPYAERGAVFVHAAPCDGPPDSHGYPADWHGRPQVLRAYDERGWIHPATTTHDGSDPVAAIIAVLGQPGVVQVHSRNVAYGCFMFTATADAARRSG